MAPRKCLLVFVLTVFLGPIQGAAIINGTLDTGYECV